VKYVHAAALVLIASSDAIAQPALTFNKDVAPIVFARCAPCHRPGEIGPFTLTSYSDVKQRVTQIADVTARRVMPPWKPVAPISGEAPRFVDERALGADEIRIIQDWIAQGAVEGDPRDLPSFPEWRDGWQLGTPDLIVTMAEAYTLAPDGRDVFRTFVVPIATTSAKYVRALEFHPGNARAVHHANLGIDRTRSSRRLDALDPAPGYAGGMVPDAGYPAGYMLGWTPGQRPRPSPDGMPWRLERDSDLVLQLHLQPTGKPERVQASVGLYFTDVAPARAPVGLRLGSETIEIAPDDPVYVVSDSYIVPVDVDLLAIQPHAHNLGRRIEATVTLPDGASRSLISIEDWDFRWQDVYRYAAPMVLPKGSTIRMRFTYDNSAGNPRNPFQPPQRIVWGQNTTDEMGDLWLQLAPRAPSDFALLNADVNRKRSREDVAAYTKLLREEPANPLRRDAVALLYLQSGRASEAVVEFRESLKLNPDSAPTHYNLGIALSIQRQYDGALAEFQEAVRLDPDHAEAHNNLGAILHFFGKVDQAAAEYQRAVTIRPDNLEARNNLGRVLSQSGKLAEAVEQFNLALAINPDFASSLSGLAWIRATAAPPLFDAAEATRLAERAAVVTNNRDPAVLDSLAAAYAAAGSFDRAVTTVKSAIQLATAAQMTNLVTDLNQRLALYERQQPYVAKH